MQDKKLNDMNKEKQKLMQLAEKGDESAKKEIKNLNERIRYRTKQILEGKVEVETPNKEEKKMKTGKIEIKKELVDQGIQAIKQLTTDVKEQKYIANQCYYHFLEEVKNAKSI
jgi:predicted transcriptional regulator YheO